MAWAFAVLVVDNHRLLLDMIAAVAIRTIGDFVPQGLSNIAWAFSTLEVRHAPLLDALSAAAMGKIQDFTAQELYNTAWSFALLEGGYDELCAALRGRCLELGRRADSLGPRSCPSNRNVVDITDTMDAPLRYETPTLALRASGLVVICKPAGWETDVYDVAKFGVPITPVARFYLLSTFIGKLFPKETYPICHCPDDGFGFVHRLDQMSSGLILAATNFTSQSALMWQMCSYRIDREYVVLCHGQLGPAPGALRVRGRILEGQSREHARSAFGDRCRVDARGKPAETRISPLAQLRMGTDDEAFTAVVISIVTGRQHQIRTHLQHIGHPSVYDGRYTHEAVTLRGGPRLQLADADRAPRHIPRPRPLPAQHRAELAMRGAYPW